MFRTSVIVALAVANPAQAGYQEGLDAYSEGDYRRAMKEWRSVTDGDAAEVIPTVYAEAHYAVAKLYWQGQGVPRDYYKAHDWLLRAAELDHAGAQAKLGYMYTDGLAVSQDYEEALRWFEKAAKNGDTDGLYNLGIFYLYGWGVEADRTRAKQYLASAAALGDPDSEAALQQVQLEDDAAEAQQQAELEAFRSQMAPRRDAPDIELLELPEEPASRFGTIADEQWILAQNSGHYTIQAMALSSLDKLLEVVAGYEQSLAPLAIYRLENKGKPLFVMLQGAYENVEAARTARDNFPGQIQQPSRVWIRRFEKVHELIRAEARE